MTAQYPNGEGGYWIVDYSVISPEQSGTYETAPVNAELEIHSVEDEDGNEQAVNDKERNKIIEYIQSETT